MKKTIVIILLAALLLPMAQGFNISALADGGEGETLFFSSFEKDDGQALLQSQPDGSCHSGIVSCPYDEKDRSDPYSYLIPQSVDGSPDGFSGEGKLNLFDGSTDTKYCIDVASISSSSGI